MYIDPRAKSPLGNGRWCRLAHLLALASGHSAGQLWTLAASTRCHLPSQELPGMTGFFLVKHLLEPLDGHMTLAEFLSQLQTQDINEHLELLRQQDDAG
ncbi:hypothetical protein R6Z07F_017716 [Ovis aries]